MARSVPSLCPVVVATVTLSAGAGADENHLENIPGGADGGDWSISSESQPFAFLSALVAAGADGAPGLEAPGLAFNHACLVFSSTGHASVDGEVCSGPWVDMFINVC